MDTNEKNLLLVRAALRDLGATFEEPRGYGIEYAHLPGLGTVSYYCNFSGPQKGYTLDTVFAVLPRGRGEGFSVPVEAISRIDLFLRRHVAK